MEAKSRHRRGVLHQVGEFTYDPAVQGEFRGLFNKACQQKSPDLPFFIFLDVNLPASPETHPAERPWFKDIQEMISATDALENQPSDPFNAVFLTNYSHYYAGGQISPGGEYGFCVSLNPQTPLAAIDPVLSRIVGTLNRYNYIPKEI